MLSFQGAGPRKQKPEIHSEVVDGFFGDGVQTIPPCEVGMFTVTILLLAGSGSLVVTTFPPTEVPVIWKVCPLDVATVVSAPATPDTQTHKVNSVQAFQVVPVVG